MMTFRTASRIPKSRGFALKSRATSMRRHILSRSTWQPLCGEHWAHESRKLQIANLQEVACAYTVRIYYLLRLLGQLAVRRFRAAPKLLRNAPNKLTREIPTGKSIRVKGTGAYSMEVRRLRCEHRFRYVSRDVSLVVAFLMGLGVFLLPLRASGSEMPSALAMANSPRVHQETNGNGHPLDAWRVRQDRKSTRLNSSHLVISY